MAHLFEICKPLSIILILQCVLKAGYTQTVCTYRVPVPDLGVCDASGGLEDNINGDMYEVKGNIIGMQEYQADNFKLLDQQINTIDGQRTQVDTEILDIAGELQTLKSALGSIQSTQASLNSSSSRGKRAVSSNSQLLQDLNAAKQSFQQSVIALEAKLQNLARQAVNYEKQSIAAHTAYQTKLTKNQQDLTTAEAQLTTIATTVQQLASSPSGFSSNPAVSTPGSAQIRQNVTDLVVEGRTAEMVAERQINNIDNQLHSAEPLERQLVSDLQAAKAVLNSTEARLNKVTQDTTAVKSAERIFEDQVGDFVSNNTVDIANAEGLLSNTTQALAQLGQRVFGQTIDENTFTGNLRTFRTSVDSVQSLVTFSEGVSVSQSTDILNLRLALMDNIRVLQYAFGATTTPP